MEIRIVEKICTSHTMFPLTDYVVHSLSNGYYYVTANDKPVNHNAIVPTIDEAIQLIQIN